MNRNSFRLFFPVLFVSLLFTMISCQTTKETVTPDDEIERQLQKELEELEKKDSKKKISFAYDVEKIQQKNEYIDADISYPRFDDLTHLDDLNVIIENNVISYYEDFKNFAREANSDLVFEYKLNFKVTTSKKIVSVYTELYNFCGDDHGNIVLITYNYDAENKEFVDVNTVSGKSFAEIAELCNSMLKEKIIYSQEGMSIDEEEILADFIDGATIATGANFNIFTVDNKKIQIYFEPNVAAPFSYGIQTVEFDIK